MDRQATIGFILIALVFVVWLYMNSPAPPPPAKSPNDTTLVKKDTAVKKDSVSNITVVDTSAIPAPVSVPETFYKIETEKTILYFSNKGAKLRRVYLKEYKRWDTDKLNLKGNESYIQLLYYKNGGNEIEFVTLDGKKINSSDLVFEPSGFDGMDVKLGKNDSVSLNFTAKVPGTGGTINFSYTVHGDKYDIAYSFELKNLGRVIANNEVDVVWQKGVRSVEENSVDEANYSNSSIYSGGEQSIFNASTIGKNEEENFGGRIDWMALRNKYFTVILAPGNPDQIEGAHLKGTSVGLPDNGHSEVYSGRLTYGFRGSNEYSQSLFLYVGPVSYKQLDAYGMNLEKVVDFGSFFGLRFIVRPIAEYVLLPIFNLLHMFIPNYGLVIIIFSIIIKLLMHPLTKSSMMSMQKMQALQPKIQEIKTKYKDDVQLQQKETMKLYSTYGINPAGGCLPMVLQMPIFIAMWGTLQSVIELRQQPFIWWIKDLSQPDVILNFGFSLPLVGLHFISGLALLMGITTFIQQKMTVKDPQQMAFVYIMPPMLTILFMTFPSGLNLYYFMFNILSIGQQYYYNQKYKGIELKPVDPSKRKKSFMEKLSEAAEQKAKTMQSQQQKKKK